GTKVHMTKIAALIVAAGKGERAGGAVPKQFQSLLGQSVLRRSVSAFVLPEIAAIQIVAAKGQRTETEAAIGDLEILPSAEGGETNLKITTQADLSHAEQIVRGTMDEFRTGQGFDAHRFAPGDHVWLCGVKIAHEAALERHSDADAGLHALTDAIFGALGVG